MIIGLTESSIHGLSVYSSLKVSSRVHQEVDYLYTAILGFLGKAYKHFGQTTTRRDFKSLLMLDDVESWLAPMHEKQGELERLRTLADAESLKSLHSGQAKRDAKLDVINASLQRLSADLKAPISRLGEEIFRTRDDLERKSRIEVLSAIFKIDIAAQHKTAHGNLVPGSGEWLLTNKHFRNSRADSCSSILWLHGILGSGKTKTHLSCHRGYDND
jgi:hypothetical protein